MAFAHRLAPLTQQREQLTPIRAGALHPFLESRTGFCSVFPNHARRLATVVRLVNKESSVGPNFLRRQAAPCYVTELPVATKRAENAVDRLKKRIAHRLDEEKDRPKGYRKTQQELAKKLGIEKSTFNELLNGPSSTRGLLAHLDIIADYFGVPPSLLVHRNDTAIIEIFQDEYRLLTHWRALPVDVQEQVMAMFDYFAGLLPEEKAQRRFWQMYRRLDGRDRQTIENQMRDTLLARRLERKSRSAPAAQPSADETAAPTPARPASKRRT